MIRRAARLLPLLALLALVTAVFPGVSASTARAIKRSQGRPAARGAGEEVRLESARTALAQGRIEEARALLRSIPAGRLPRELEEDAAYLRALVAPDAASHEAILLEYVSAYPRGRHRRAAALALAKIHYAQGDYRESENLLSVFSPGVEQDALGREGLVWRGYAQLGRADAPGALQFLQSARKDLDGSGEEEAYYFALAQAALRASRPGEAVEALRPILARHPNGDYAPQALYAMGVSLEMMGRAADGAALFRQVVQRHPGSYEATRARDRGVRGTADPGSPLPIGGGFAIQVGAFSRKEVAEALARDLRVAGVADVSVSQGREAPPIYRVRAGVFPSRDEARSLGERLRRERGFSYTIVSR